ncbi:hypothetical protein DUI87_03172 [Hirundo rustica rustica]|uniref:RNase H type-1 domain-containing protein n=1 Tax=Hirundo rustica rustica TaxID=333673 RepID=A0A3M0L220_HIRRU|nr:hypothetical protein DUI87_03172 [Hirundo rustica rustica]
MTHMDHDIAKPILTTDSNYTPYRLRLTEGLHLKDDDWKLVLVNNGEQGNWPRGEGKLIVVGDCKHNPQEIKILPGTLDNNPERFVLWLRCTHPTTFLPKGQIVAQIIPAWERPEDSMPTACPVYNITEAKPQVACELSVGGEAINMTGLLDTGADLTIFPAKHWPSHWALEDVAGHVQGFELQEDKVQRMPPWRYLGLEIGKWTIVPQKLEIKAKIETLADVHQLCGALNCVRPWLGLTTEDLAPLFNFLKGGEELSSPRELTLEAKDALGKVQHLMSTWQAHQCDLDLHFKFIIMGKLPHLHGVIFQWRKNIKKDQGREDPLLIMEWVFLSHQRSKRMTHPQELVAELIRKARVRIRELAGCDFECIHIPIGLRLGQITKAMLEHLLQENEALQFALDSFTGQISIHRPAHKIFNQDAKFTLSLKSVQSRKPLDDLTVFTDTSRRSHKSVMTWKDPQTQQWEADVAEVEGSPQVAELAAVVRAFERFPKPFNLVTHSAYVAGVVSRADQAVLQEVSNTALFELLSKLVKLVSHREQPFFVMHTRSHTDLPGFIAEGNRKADALAAPAAMAPLPNIFEQAKLSHQLFHQTHLALFAGFTSPGNRLRQLWLRVPPVINMHFPP